MDQLFMAVLAILQPSNFIMILIGLVFGIIVGKLRKSDNGIGSLQG